MRVLISQPTEGLTEEQARQAKARIVAEIESQGHTVVDISFNQTDAPEGVDKQLWILGKTIQGMAGVDAVYFMDGWEISINCILAFEAAVGFGLKTLNVDRSKLQFRLLIDKQSDNTEGDSNFFPDYLVPPKPHWQIIKTGVYMGAIFGYGEFLLDSKSRTLICLKQTVEAAKTFGDPIWSAISDNNVIQINPVKFCENKKDNRRFVNNAAKLFHKLRDIIMNGDVYIDKDKYSGIKFEIDSNGRYRIINYEDYPVACMYAIACSFLY